MNYTKATHWGVPQALVALVFLFAIGSHGCARGTDVPVDGGSSGTLDMDAPVDGGSDGGADDVGIDMDGGSDGGTNDLGIVIDGGSDSGTNDLGTVIDGGSDSGATGDSCATNNGGCDVRTSCMATAGTVVCGPCPSGYTGSGASGCLDIDECATGTANCDQDCSNTPGDFTCSCDTGYILSLSDRKTCLDVDECGSGSGPCEQICDNERGSFTCSCRRGYTLGADGLSCTDVNECAAGTDNCEQDCANTVGSFTCSCGTGFVLDADNRSCSCVAGFVQDTTTGTCRRARHCAEIMQENPQAPSGVYSINPGGGVVNTYCGMGDDLGGWTLVYNQDMDPRASEDWNKVNVDSATPTNGDYSILYQLRNLGSTHGYEFLYEWFDGPTPYGYVQWIQSGNPLEIQDTQRAPISVVETYPSPQPSGCQPFAGLATSSQAASIRALLDGDAGSCSWFAVGVSVGYIDGVEELIPVYRDPSLAVVHHVRLFVRPAWRPAVPD